MHSPRQKVAISEVVALRRHLRAALLELRKHPPHYAEARAELAKVLAATSELRAIYDDLAVAAATGQR